MYVKRSITSGNKAKSCEDVYRRTTQLSGETFFSNQNNRGFNTHKNRLADPARLSRILMTASLAYIWKISQGISVPAMVKICLIDRAERVNNSLFDSDWVGSNKF